ncbi:MAG: SIMPL domain-containing protein [Phycisphaeraceae bacterium]|nr:SIMPL domain-containing protein [Phycisphaeraceae bacterium]
MKRTNILWVTSIALLLAATAVADDMVSPRPMLSVTGRGEVTVEPDRAIVSFGAVVQSEEAAAAQDQVNETMSDTIDAITRLGVARNKLSTSDLTLQPVYESSRSSAPRTSKVVAYRAAYMLTVVVDDIDKTGDVIDAGLSSGVNQFHGVQFTLKDDSAARNEALKQAVASARSKATAIADAMEVKLDYPLRISEGGDYSPMPRPMHAGGRAVMATAEFDTPVQAGELTISATVSVDYAINP